MLGALALGAQRLLPVFQQIYNGWSQARGNLQMAREVLDFFEGFDPQTMPDPVEPLPFCDSIRLVGVGLHYSDRSPALRDLSFEIPRGACVGLIGASGSGKSSLINLASGLLRPTTGEILIDDVPLNEGNLPRWQARIALVPQEIYLADMSIAANIAFPLAPELIDHARLREAARQARIDSVIDSLPDGYDTVIGERGVSLAGGQRQRIAIARALYRRADVLMFDEATSSLDFETEAEVMATIAALAGENTVLFATHRLANLRICDMVIRLDEGRVVSVEREPQRIATHGG
jgi:ABC-type multidrug transport system fused ATPase/permease subunit